MKTSTSGTAQFQTLFSKGNLKHVGSDTNEIMTSVFQAKGTPSKARVYYAVENNVIMNSDTDILLPPLDAGTVRRVNSSNVLEQNRYEKYRNQLQKEKDEAKLRFYCRKQDFLRSSIVIQQRNVRSSKRKFRLISESAKKQELSFTSNKLYGGTHKVRDDLIHDQSTDNTREHTSLNNNPAVLLRPPYFLPPLYKSIILDAKEIKERKEKQDGEGVHLNILTANDLKSCRYLRIAGKAKLLFDLQKQTDSVY